VLETVFPTLASVMHDDVLNEMASIVKCVQSDSSAVRFMAARFLAVAASVLPCKVSGTHPVLRSPPCLIDAVHHPIRV